MPVDAPNFKRSAARRAGRLAVITTMAYAGLAAAMALLQPQQSARADAPSARVDAPQQAARPQKPTAPINDAPRLAILPGDFTLNGAADRMTLLVESMQGGRATGQANDVDFTISDPGILKVEGAAAIPLADGAADITANSNGQSAVAHVHVSGMGKPVLWSFRNDVEPVLARAGCSMGACHGALAGQNGFKLSLRGYDPDGDWKMITRNALGRRVCPTDPSSSLILLKPTMAVPHKGGERFKPDALEYRVLAQWVAQGMAAPESADKRIERIEMLPERMLFKPGAAQQALVVAHYSDGSARDVTRWSKFTATEAGVATVDDNGLVKCAGPGEGFISAWFSSKIAAATVSSPYPNGPGRAAFAAMPRHNFIDDLILAKLEDLDLPASGECGDGEFIRRAFIDTLGILPKPEETRAFLADQRPDKRARFVDGLLARPEFVDYWSYKWSDLLLVSSKRLSPEGMWSYYRWIRQQVADNTPWDQFVRKIVTARGSTLQNGAANFYLLHDDPAQLSENASLAFLGMSINCARCHNHPLEKWTNDEYFAMANLFARVRVKGGAGGASVVFSADDGDVVQPLRGRPQPPAPLGAPAIPLDAPGDRRAVFADWLVSRDNPYFARAAANRVWANFMGVGLVEKVDDMRQTNPASNEKLLSALADHLADNKFDLKALMRLILNSEAYQRSSAPLPQNAADTRLYSRYYARRMMAETLLDAASQVAGAPTQFANYPLGWRAMQLPDSNIDSYFLRSFGRADRVATCTCERTAEPSVAQALHIANGDAINAKLAAKGNRIDQLLKAGATDAQVIEEAYMAALCRAPTEAEKKKILSIWGDSKGAPRRQLIEDLYWGVLSSNEFLFDH